MKKLRCGILFITATVFGLAESQSQIHLIVKADEQYRKFEYINAQQTYLKAIERGANSSKVYENLGNSYFYNGQYGDASKWYHQLITTYPNETDPEYYFRYVQTLRSNEQFDKADAYMDIFTQLRPSDARGQLFQAHREYLKEIDSMSHRYLVDPISINSQFTDFGPSFFGDNIVFSSSRKPSRRRNRIHQWNKESYLDLFMFPNSGEAGNIGSVEKWNDSFNSRYHDSSPVFTADQKTIYFTRNNADGGTYEQVRTYKLRTDKLKVYRSQVNSEGIWSEPEELPFNSDRYSVAHPALNPEGTLLYFASDMPGGYGDSDLYEVAIHPDGSFGVPKNLGKEINTEGKETFPFISKTNTLYFASDARGGLGGLDIYLRAYADRDTTLRVYNMGRPINSAYDDFALIIDADKKSGFFSSNRPGGKGKDDIYSFVERIPEPEPEPFQAGEDLAELLDLNPIYFDLDKSFIRKDAALELNKVVQVLKAHPSIRIHIRSHTDSRASHAYNIKLSQRRAKSTKAYLVSSGIDAERLFTKGYGETQLLNECKDGVYCSEEKHQLNRRSEFIIIAP